MLIPAIAKRPPWSDLEQAIKNGEPLKEITRLLDSGAPSTGWSEGGALVTAVNEERDDVVSLLLDRGADINMVFGEYGTALAAAAFKGSDQIVHLLLNRGADINAMGGKCWTALAAAAFANYTQTVELLLDREADMSIVGGEYGTALTTAAFVGSLVAVELLLDRGAFINAVHGKYGTALTAAASEGRLLTIQLLLDRGANINAVGGEYGTPLAAASTRGLITTKLLIDRGANINIEGGKYNTPLVAASLYRQIHIVSFLLDRGANINAVGGEYGTALAATAFGGGTSIIALLLDRGADINVVGGEYGTALAAAAFAGFVLAVTLLLNRGADIDAEGGRYGTALAAAALKGRIKTVRLLLDWGADINGVSGKYGTALATATHQGSEEIVTLLLDRGADINAVGGKYGTALAVAAFQGRTSNIALLLDRGANINAVGGEYGTALAAAALGGKMNAVSLLLDRGADINAMGGKYGTALTAAAFAGIADIVRLLLDCGADTKVVGGKYGTALATASSKGFNRIVNLLLDQGADINMVGTTYGTALTLAAYHGRLNTVPLLLDRGAKINMECGQYGTALAAAALGAHGNPRSMVTLLLDRRADINAVGGECGTPLAAATFGGTLSTMKLLLERGADPQVVGGEYGTALATAVFRGRTDTVSLLLRHGADITHVDSYSTANGKVNTEISRPPFPMPYSGDGTLSPSLSSPDILSKSTRFCAGDTLTAEQADVPCQKISEEDLWYLLSALLGLHEDTRSKAGHPWIQNDIQYFITHQFDFGLAYAAARVAWKNFKRHSMDSSIILVERSRWHQHVQVLDEARSKAIEIDNSSFRQELIISPYSIMPRRLWDLRSNRVIDFQMLHAAQSTITTPPLFWALSHSWTNDMSPVWTTINQHQWPVPLPKKITLNYLRTELLAFGAEYVWLDVVCLRQKTEIDSLEQLRQQEWKLDVPTIGNIYRAAVKVVRYFNGLGIRFSNNGWDDPRHWLQRAWTLQEIATENRTINGGVPRDLHDGHQVFLNSQGMVSGRLVKFRSAISPVLQLTAQVDSQYGCEIYELAREMAKRHATQQLDKLSGLFYLLRTTKLPCYDEKLTSEDIWRQCFHLLPPERKAEVLFDFPYRGSDKQWFPTWAQVLDWPTRDPEYTHMRSQSLQDLISYIPGETSCVIRDLWTISGAVLYEADCPGEYRVEIGKGQYGFYLPYLSQKPFDIQDQSVFTLATMNLGHAYNWVVCRAVGNRVGKDVGLVGVAEVICLKKVGVIRTDSCSELSVGGINGASLLQKMNCLFV